MLRDTKQKDKKEQKNDYRKPILIKHKKLNDITAGANGSAPIGPVLGCSRSY